MSEFLDGAGQPIEKNKIDEEKFAAQRSILAGAHNEGTPDHPVVIQFSEYFDPSVSLEDRVGTDMDELQIDINKREVINLYLELIRNKHKGSYDHSLRVGLIARKIAKFRQLDEKALLYAGLLHDVGKTMIPMSTLAKTEGWTPEDSAIMEAHVESGYKLLRDQFDFTAEVILRHHRSQRNSYPKNLPEPLHKYAEDTKLLIDEYGRILALADVYDALHRINDKNGNDGKSRALSGTEIHKQMLSLNPDRVELIEQLYDAGVFIVNT